MIVETPDGEKEKVEQTLEQYGLVVQGRLEAEQLLSDPLAVIALKNKLEISALELKQTREMFKLLETSSSGRIAALERQVDTLQLVVGEGLKGSNTAARLLEKLLNSHLDLTSDVRDGLELITNKIEHGIKESDEPEVKAALATVHRNDPSVFDELNNFVRGSLHGAGGNLLSSWILALTHTLPKA